MPVTFPVGTRVRGRWGQYLAADDPDPLTGTVIPRPDDRNDPSEVWVRFDHDGRQGWAHHSQYEVLEIPTDIQQRARYKALTEDLCL